ncbi:MULTISPECIES: nucleotide exchange factor GrpE [unclassified Paenibacillus]|uniref:nucleotide exchange factor GrpE n=1 Tax=unclassified Paenibacillus TaxID=185978 RepID=UPI002405D64C|nr:MULTISPECIES: nucleotide exchange factor GrpE [unclassified Paenibacillus]MDF9842488.1 molecular chaperone GrpE (heat shock protein) [Paenibacillus sp. PastF-2]MDF9849078.1 molecular chaperone GrpE (heat shock protein) [Paenibacillus sp. PastM-2]MDF9855648.1 molecular chaperone GrpE (heat shock protein) [Paenibacillus sp. PastF-1]MDH6480920.1 molecular chaperone GrpE (heat shock protein) [Paenibacillus sp. PastH-2]MDH6508342.1 molecular chaperone GrpE (heat shock protein) [Paenibacillus sp.
MWFGKRLDAVRADVQRLNGLMESAGAKADEQLSGIAEQGSKLARLTYKNGKDTADKLERLNSLLESQESGWKVAYEQEKARSAQNANALQSAAAAIMGWLDDLDAIAAGQRQQENSLPGGWEQLTGHWQAQMLGQLLELGLKEINVLGKMFEPALCEAVGTIPMSPDAESIIPYEVVSVLRRGYQLEDGSLYRKAQVITLSKESMS